MTLPSGPRPSSLYPGYDIEQTEKCLGPGDSSRGGGEDSAALGAAFSTENPPIPSGHRPGSNARKRLTGDDRGGPKNIPEDDHQALLQERCSGFPQPRAQPIYGGLALHLSQRNG